MDFLKQLLAFTVLLAPCIVNGQPNHVPNGSFETYTNCPGGGVPFGSVFTNSWYSYAGSPDCYNPCNTTGPNNGLGLQSAADGIAYVGMLTYTSANSVREFAATKITPLIPGATYKVSMSISLSEVIGYGSGHDKIGATFFKNGPTSVPFGTFPPFTPQLTFSGGPFMDTANWTRLSSTFVADTAYEYMIIGCFVPNNQLTVAPINPNNTNNNAYYYFDSIVVTTIDTLFCIYEDTILCAGDTIDVDYISYKKKKPTNTFKIQLSSAAGSFSSPVDIGSFVYDTSGVIKCVIPSNTPTGNGYKMRVIASSFADTAYGYRTYKIGNGVSKPVASNNGLTCSNDTLQLSATSSTQNVQYKWTGPGGFTANVQNPSIIKPQQTQAGNYIVTAYFYGCEASDTTITAVQTVFDPTGVSATANGPICADDTLRGYGSPDNNNYSYSWTGPGGFSSTTKDFIIAGTVVTQSGNYILSVINGVCTVKDTVAVTIKPRPADFGAVYNAPLCSGNTLNLTASTTSTGVTYAWTGPNGFSATSATPGISGASAAHNGNYYVTATLNGCSLSDTVVVTVKPKPAVPTMNNNGPVCAGETIMLAAASTTGGASYSWIGPNSYTSSLQNPTIGNSTTSMSGTYTATTTLDGCSSSATTSVTVKPMPTAVTTSSNTPVCAGNNLLVSIGTSTSGSTYSWTGPNSFTSANLSNTISSTTTAATGWYVAKVDLNGCSFKDSVYATVNPIPATPTISFNSPLCFGETLNLNGGSVTGGSYSWTGPNGFTSTQNNPARSNMQWADTGMYKTTVTVNGCPSTEAQVRVGMNPVPFVTIFSNPMDTICNGQAVTFTALANNHGGTPLYQWLVNGSLVSTGTTFNTSSLSNQDVVRCDMTEYTKCSVPYKDESNDITMTVMPWLAPSVSITANPTTPLKPDEFITFTAKPVDGGTIPKFQWKRNGQNIVGATGAIWSANTLNDNDDICVELTSTYRCPQPLTANSNCIKVRVLTGVDDISGSNKWTVHPNPNNGRFTITAKDIYSTEARLEVVNTLGQIVYRHIVTTQQGSINKEVNLNDVAKGIYLLRIYAEDEINIVKLQVE